MNKPGRNDPCLCGSGKKYKQCCLSKEETPSNFPLPATPANSEVNQLLAAAREHHQTNRLQQASSLYQQVLRAHPDHPDALHLLGILANQVGQHDTALNLIGHALLISPTNHHFHNSLGMVYRAQKRDEEALNCYQKAVQLEPTYTKGYFNLGNTLNDLGRPNEAIAAFHHALALDPGFVEARHNLSHLLLLTGDFPNGWREYESRYHPDRSGANRPVPPPLSCPMWRGEPLTGKTLLIYPEQGLGDEIQFCRYVPLLLRLGAKLRIVCKAPLERLFQSIPNVLIQSVDAPLAPTDGDFWTYALSLPYRFGTTLDTIPNTVPYLAAPPEKIAGWRERLAKLDPQPRKIGLVWAGWSGHPNDHNRSLHLAQFAPLAEIPGVQFISLQKGERAAEASQPPMGMQILPLGDELHDFSDTAAVLENLNLLICVDTSIAHLAGALGKPVWTLLPSVPDWRWLLARDDSPWYPSMRLFRQPTVGDWDNVIASLKIALENFVA